MYLSRYSVFSFVLQKPPKTWEKLWENMWLYSTARIRWTTEDLGEFSKVNIFNACSQCFRRLKGPLKYLVAKLHGCYPNATSLPVSQNIFARFCRRRPVADSSRSCLFFLLRCNKHKKNFSFSFLLINFLLYGYNM